ncbi:MAG: U32 family peptidase C-terminal domain-containing protein, partial [SAR324 cluster bacterium]|nr:U32 family peptidase C-terminal domain-containing protein [SAR324 cluster bacterium]
IEGRMKSNLYIASTVRAYANALKEIRKQGSFRKAYWQQELTHLPHRDYTEASLLSPAGPESVYNSQKTSHSEFKLAGTVLEVDRDRGRFALHVKNKLHLGDTIEIMPFEGEVIQLILSTLTNLAGQNQDLIQPGNVCWLPLGDHGIAPRNVARVWRHAGGLGY